MPTGNYSHMVMEMEHMVDGDGLGDDGGEDDVEFPLSIAERKTDLIPETKIVVAAALWFPKDSVLLGRRVFGVYKDVCMKEEARRRLRTKWAHLARRGYPHAPRGPICSLLISSRPLWLVGRVSKIPKRAL